MSLISTMLKTYKGNNLSQEEIKKLQQKRLKQLVKYARNNSPYFKDLYAGIGDNFSLEELPTTNKIEMMKNFDNWITDNNISMKKIKEFTSDIENVGRMIDGKYLIFKTSGSTGNPATVLYDKQNIDVASAVAAFRTFARKEDFKAFMKNGKKTAGVFANYGFYLACGMSRYLQLQMPRKKNKITVDVNASEKEIIKELNEFNPAMLSGYPSNLALLSDFEELTIKPNLVITGGELLTNEIRKKLTDKFNCYVQTHYSCTEAGEVACECSEKHLHINEDWVIVEPVDKNNKPVGYGVRSDKVLITNLSNYIQPFIRYELTDRIIVHNEKCKCGKNSCWLEIEGRTDDILEFENNVLIAPMSFYKILEEIKEITRFQLIQKSYQKLELRLIADKKDVVFEKAKKELQEFLNSKSISNVEIFLSEELPQANKISGKYNHVYKDFKKKVLKNNLFGNNKKILKGGTMNKYMKIAKELANENLTTNAGGPFGACIVKNGQIIGKGSNHVLASNDPTAHAEIMAIRDACSNINTYDLSDCELYTTCYPCPMCLSAIIWANIKKVYYGNTKEDAAEIGFRDDFIYDFIEKLSTNNQENSILDLKSMDREETIEEFNKFKNKEDKTIY